MSSVIGNLRVVLGLDSAAFQKGMTDAASSLKKIGADMQRVGRSLSVRVTAPLAGFGALSIRTAADFEAAMNRVRAVSGATGDDLEALTKQARELGKTTQFSAADAADAMGFLAMAGYKTEQILGAMPDTLRLASAAQLDMASAADIVTNILAGYSMEVEDLAHANDVLVKAFTSANTDLRQLGEAMKYAGPVASAAGVEFEEAAASLAMMGNAGIQASMAGTSLRGAISRILSPTKKMQTIMDEAGLSFTDAHGRILPLADIIEQLEPHADNAGMMMELFGQRAGPAMAALVSQGAESVRDLTSELRDSAGTAESISKVQMEGFNGALKELQSAFDELKITIANTGLMAAVKDLVLGLTSLINKVSAANPELLRWGVIIASVAAAMGPVLIGLGFMVSGMAALAGVFAAVVPVVSAVAAGIAALSAPVAAAVAVIAGAAYLIWDNWEKVGPWFTDLFSGLMDTFAGLADFIVGLVNGDLSMASAGLQRSWEGLQLFFETLWDGVVAAFRWAKEQIQPIIDWFDEAVGRIDRGLNRITGASKDGPISSGAYTGGATGPVLPGTSVPMDMQRGLQDGTAGIRAQGVTDAEAYGDGFREGMGIRSPSRVMIEIGEYLSQGLGIGIENGQPYVQNASENVGQSFADSIMPYFDGVIRGTSSVREAFSSMLQDMASQLMSSGLRGLLGSLFGGGGFLGLGIPGFAAGGQHGGGWRIVGERGPELEATGPARYFTAAQTQQMLAGGGAGGEVDVRVFVDNGGNWQAEVARIAGRVSATVVGETGRRQSDRSYLTGGRMMQVHFPPNIRIRRVRPRLEGLRFQPFSNIDGEAFARPALNGFWRLETELLCASLQEHLALSSFLTAMRGAATTLLPLPTRWLPDLRAERPLMSGGGAPEYTTDHTGFSGSPYDGFTLSASATHRDSYIDVDKPELVQLMPGHFVSLGERLHQVVDVSAIDEREDRIRVSLMPGVRGDYPAGTLVVVDQLQLRCSLKSAGDIDLWNIPHSELSAVFIEAF